MKDMNLKNQACELDDDALNTVVGGVTFTSRKCPEDKTEGSTTKGDKLEATVCGQTLTALVCGCTYHKDEMNTILAAFPNIMGMNTTALVPSNTPYTLGW